MREIESLESRELWRLVDLYRAEAERCRETRAYLAGCVMLGSALEAGLLLLAECHIEDVQASGKVPKSRGGAPKPPQRWTLGELLGLGQHMTWIPASLGDVGDYAWAVQKTRNLVHPGKYVTEYAGVDVGKEDYEAACTTVQAAFDWLDRTICHELSREGP